MKVKSLSRVRLLATPWTAAHQAPPSMGFSRQEDWSGVPLPSPFANMNTRRVPLLLFLQSSCALLPFLSFSNAYKIAYILPVIQYISSFNSSCSYNTHLLLHFFVNLQEVATNFPASFTFSSVAQLCLRPHESQHARPLCPSPSPGVHSDSRPSVSDAIQPSHPRSFPSPPAPNPSQHQGLFQ